MSIQCRLYVCPGADASDKHGNAHMSQLVQLLQETGTEYKFFDNSSHGCLIADSVDFYCEIETTWGRPTLIDEVDWHSRWYPLLRRGELRMMITEYVKLER